MSVECVNNNDTGIIIATTTTTIVTEYLYSAVYSIQFSGNTTVKLATSTQTHARARTCLTHTQYTSTHSHTIMKENRQVSFTTYK